MYTHTLDKTSKKHICPKCGEKRFVLYVSTIDHSILDSSVGRCDREGKCKHHFPPREYFALNPSLHDINRQRYYQWLRNTKFAHRDITLVNTIDKTPDYIPKKLFLETLKNDYSKNNFVLFSETRR